MRNLLFPALLALLMMSCVRNVEENPTRLLGQAGTITVPRETPKTVSKPLAEKPQEEGAQHWNVGPSATAQVSDAKDEALVDIVLPNEAELSDELSSRLEEKLKEAYEGRGTPPKIGIYLSSQSLDEFASYYEGKGYAVQRSSVPAAQILRPLLESDPTLESKIKLSDYAGVVIQQVVVAGINVSAADKYIDPETYQIIDRTFITVTK